MSKEGSLQYQILKRLDSLEAYGTSRREARFEAASAQGISYRDAKSPFIHSTSTKQAYKKWCLAGADWIKQEFGVKNLKDIRHEQVKGYLEMRQGKGDSAWTLKLIGAAFGKLLGTSAKTFGFTFPACKTEDIKRGRTETPGNTRYGNVHPGLKGFIRATGLRRCEMQNLRGDHFHERQDGKGFVLFLQGKHGKWRVVEPIEAAWAKSAVEKMYQRCKEAGLDKKVWPKVDRSYNEHGERAWYAYHRYLEIAKPESRPRQLQIHRRNGEVLDKVSLYQVSSWLGHGRYDVVLRNYWYRH